MILSKITKILITSLISILLITGVILVIKNIKKDTNTNQPITEQPINTNPEDNIEEPITDDNEPTPDIKPEDNQTTPSDQPIINPEPETTSNDQPTSSEITELDTTNWKTYTNEEYGFSFKYPEPVSIMLRGFDNAIDDANPFLLGIDIATHDNKGRTLTIVKGEDYLEKVKIFPADQKIFSVDNIDWVMLKWEGGSVEESPYMESYFKIASANSGNTFIFSSFDIDDLYLKDIVSSFRFFK